MVKNRSGVARAGLAIALCASLNVSLSACDVLPPKLEGFWLRLQKGARIWVAQMKGETLPLPQQSPSPEPTDIYSQRAQNAKANAELLHEVLLVVYMREPTDKSMFGTIVDSLNQGATLEGMYNGFTHSAEYRKIEMANSGATPEALKVFGQELAILEAELPVPVEFDAMATRPLALPVEPGVEPHAPPTPLATSIADGVNVIEYGKHHEGDPLVAPSVRPPINVEALADKYTQQFVGASIFTLKRVLGDEALKIIASKKQYPEKLALWYGRWVQHMSSLGVDFGLSLRNKPDEAFHYKWALSAAEDRMNWEVLNRLHRVLNESNKQKQ